MMNALMSDFILRPLLIWAWIGSWFWVLILGFGVLVVLRPVLLMGGQHHGFWGSVSVIDWSVGLANRAHNCDGGGTAIRDQIVVLIDSWSMIYVSLIYVSMKKQASKEIYLWVGRSPIGLSNSVPFLRTTIRWCHATTWHPPDQGTVFGFFHTDEKISLHVIRFIRNRHSTMVVGIIGSGVSGGKSDESLFQKAMGPYFKKRWLLISKSDGSERKSDSSIQHLIQGSYR